ncbi:UDP-N-acetylhexosamine pyrophosphorylase-like protein 1 [Clavelina lepadiformis]|uniref:UDP-N-acetylhexosamine pyrophosphorylase-like protein 1 n=1 Tax=Clavelina lepadiformis TaxID=159417 RepID=UPI004042803D
MSEMTDVLEELRLHKQEQLLVHFDDLDAKEKQNLLNDIKNVDFGHLEDIRKRSNELSKSRQSGRLDKFMEPIPSEQFGSIARGSAQDKLKWEKAGLECIAEGKVAVLVLAGGQGTRLGVPYPKGMYDVGLPSGKSLYQIKAERIKRLQDLAFERTGKHGIITWYIMTSEATMGQTRDYFKDNNYFGLSENNVKFFEQFTLPCIDFDGKILLANKHKIACAPDGNGGLYKALTRRKVLDDMERRGIECTHVHCVDNILTKTADPVFIGFCRLMKADCGAKVVEKTEPNEAVGVICKVDGVCQAVEYSEISSATASKKDNSGTRLMFNAGNICNHFFSTDFLKNVCSAHKELPHHVAKKKIPHVNRKGEVVRPTTPNGMKMEKFVFDVFQYAKHFVVFEVPREDEFSPLKNAEGATSCGPLQSRWSLASLHHRRIVSAGGSIVDSDGNEVPPLTGVESHEGEYPVVCEISPLLSYDGEGLAKYCDNVKFQSPVILDKDLLNRNGNA